MNKKRKETSGKVISFIPDGPFYYKKALHSMQRERFGEAKKYLKRAAELSPNDPLILTQFGVLVMEEGHFDEAYDLLMRAHELDPNEEDTIFYLAEVHAHLGLLRDAKMYAQQYVTFDPEGSFVDEAMEIIDFAEQEELYFEEDDVPDGAVFFLQEKARKLMEEGHFLEAIELLESIILDYPDFWAAYNNLALAYFYVGETKKAEALLHEVLDQDKGNIHALCNLAVFYYYENRNEELQQLLSLLVKIKPYQFEQRYKLGATFALVGKHTEAYNWLRSLQKRGFEGDAGFYFWLAHSAYYSGHDDVARDAFSKLIELDPSKAGYEPWSKIENEDNRSIEQDREFIISKISNKYRSERIFGFYLLGKSIHKQEIISHPSYIDVEKLTPLEQLFLATSLQYEFSPKTPFEKAFLRAVETTDLLYHQYRPLDKQASHLFQMWFTLCEAALSKAYHFRNPNALAASADYMFQSSRYAGITKKAMAAKYGISVPTLTKYVEELIAFLPIFNK